MATTQPKSGVTEYTSTTGTGPVTLSGPATGYRGFVSADDGKTWHYAIRQAGVTFETGLGTYTHSSRQISRGTVLGNKDGTTSPLNLGAGTKEVSIVLPGERVSMLDSEGHYAADQYHDGYRIYLDADGNSWIEAATDDVFKFFAGAVRVLQANGGLGNLTLTGTNDTATEGPELTLTRDSATPAASDAGGVIRMKFRDSGGTEVTGFKMRNVALGVTAGNHSSSVTFEISKAGANQPVMTMRPDTISLPSGVSLFTGGKTVTNLNSVGAELFSSGELACVAQDAPALYVYRKGSDTDLVQFGRDGASVGAITVAAGTLTYGPFTGHHYVEWAAGEGGAEFELRGTVVQTAPGLLASAPDPIKFVRPASNGSRQVYGVIAGRQLTKILNNEYQALLVMFAVGNGWIRAAGPIADGDLLWASSTPGVAERQPNQDQVGPWTVAKAVNDSPDDGGERLVPCVLMAG